MQIAITNNESQIVKSPCKFNNSQSTRDTTNAIGKVNEFASVEPAMQPMQQRSVLTTTIYYAVIIRNPFSH